MKKLREWLAQFDRDIAVWSRVVHGVGDEYPVPAVKEQEPQIFALTGEELKARLAEVIQ